MCLISGFDPWGGKKVIIVIHHFLFLAGLFSFYQMPLLIASVAICGFVQPTPFSSYLIFFDARLLSEVKDQWSLCHQFYCRDKAKLLKVAKHVLFVMSVTLLYQDVL